MVKVPERRLTCPKCGGQFDYQFVWGASLTAVRLGSSRYMRCPLCRKWALFPLLGPATVVPRGPRQSGNATPQGTDRSTIRVPGAPSTPLRESAPTSPPHFTDVRVTALGCGILGAIAVAIVVFSYVLPWPEPRLGVVIAGTVSIAVVALVFFVFFRVREHPPRAS